MKRYHLSRLFNSNFRREGILIRNGEVFVKIAKRI